MPFEANSATVCCYPLMIHIVIQSVRPGVLTSLYLSLEPKYHYSGSLLYTPFHFTALTFRQLQIKASGSFK